MKRRGDGPVREILARTIHDRFYCDRGLAARLAWRLRDFATNRHEYCGLAFLRRVAYLAPPWSD
jgi:hypothetical protein